MTAFLARAVAVLVFAAATAAGTAAMGYVETPELAPAVADGRLPPIDQRLPKIPMVAEPDRPDVSPGRPGGELRMLMGRPQDVRMMAVYGYSRLVVLNTRFELVPDILERATVEDERIFTLHLRPGHRWSDGHPFTAEDFRYWWEDVALNKTVSPVGPPKILYVDGQPPKVEFLDPLTIRYSWTQRNPYFLASLAGPSPLYLYRPAHYLKQFHAKYADKDALAAAVKKASMRNWAQLHNRLDNLNRNDNPDLPTLDPWVVLTKPPAERFVFVRNPYYHRVDTNGRQLPYIDRVVITVADGRIIAPKTGSGESDLQARGLTFANYTFLRQSAKRNDLTVHLWHTAKGAHLAIYPNLTVNDPVWRGLHRDTRFRRALSLAVDRHEINQVVYFGLGIEGGNTLLPTSPLYRPEYRNTWARFDLKNANRLLDEMGLTKRDGRGVRLLPNGKPLEVIVETAGEDTEQTDVLELVHDSWMQAGVKLYSKPSQREIFRNRVFAGETRMAMWYGIENGLATANMSPEEFAPTRQDQLQWPKWGQYLETGGASGEPIDDPVARELFQLNEAWRKADSAAARETIWHRILELDAKQVYSIGLIAGVRQPVVVSNRLRNVPVDGIYNWDPGAFFGIYRPDSFWFAGAGETASAN
ncbi:MAG: ABC transporter substrate-binding protein [Proteobacteria bacterium]|nr:ABC transporter substrate-binding protein [Pseudomonadota bacterium]